MNHFVPSWFVPEGREWKVGGEGKVNEKGGAYRRRRRRRRRRFRHSSSSSSSEWRQ